MGTGQMLLTLAGMILLATVILGVNNRLLTTSDTMINTKLGVIAVSLGSSIIEEASSKQFDTLTIETTNKNLLTAPADLGHEDGEVYPNFNDFDDFHNYTQVDTNAAIFNIASRICYVEPKTSPSRISEVNYVTWFKKIEVKVTSHSMRKANGDQDTLTFSSIFSYWD